MTTIKTEWLIQEKNLDGVWVYLTVWGGRERLFVSPTDALEFNKRNPSNRERRVVKRTIETVSGSVVKPVAIPPLPSSKGVLTEMIDAIDEFNTTFGASIQHPHAGEPIDRSMIKIVTGLIQGVTKVLEDARKPPAAETDGGYWQEAKS